MKLWQVRFDVVSNEMICENSKKYISEWYAVKKPLICDDEFIDMYPKSVQTDSVTVFGDLNGTYIGINCTDLCVNDVFFCVDARNIDMDLIGVICDFVRDNNAKILIGGHFYEPDEYVLENLIKRSKAYEFVKNPIKYLNKC